MTAVTFPPLWFSLVGVVFVAISIPLIKGKIPPNHFYGFRTPKTLSDPKIWYEINRISGNDFFIAGVIITMSSLAMWIFARNIDPRISALTLVSVMVLAMIGATMHGFLVLRRM